MRERKNQLAKVVLINKDSIAEELKLAGWHASVSYDSSADHTKIATHCIGARHGTPTRGMRFVFEISEVSRAFSHEFVRHELGVGKVQRSQRYVNEDGFQYVTPNALIDVKVQVQIPLPEGEYFNRYGESLDYAYVWLNFDNFQDIVEQMYNGYVALGIKPEDARYALTNATWTKIHVVMNWEGLMQFCYRRCCTRAQWEIRNVAFQMKQEVFDASNFLGNKLGAHCFQHGYCPELPKGCGIAPSREEFLRLYHIGRQASLGYVDVSKLK